jgi:outer membrane protein
MKTTSLTPLAALLALASSLFAGQAAAQSYTVKVGGIYIDPRATSTDLVGTLPTGITALPLVADPGGNQLAVQPKSTLVLSIERAFNDNWSAELVLGAPPKHDVKLQVGAQTKAQAASTPTSLPTAVARGVAAHVAADDGQVVASVKQAAPTLFLNYRFFDATRALRPFIGVGVNYTHMKATSTDVGNALYNDGPVRISLTDSIGLAAQIGVVYQIDKNWSLNGSWATAAVKNHLTIRTNMSEQTATYRFHPSAFSATVGYTF